MDVHIRLIDIQNIARDIHNIINNHNYGFPVFFSSSYMCFLIPIFYKFVVNYVYDSSMPQQAYCTVYEVQLFFFCMETCMPVELP